MAGNNQRDHIIGSNKQEIKYMLLHKSVLDPSALTPVEGQFYYSTNAKALKIYDTAWKYIPNIGQALLNAGSLLTGNGINITPITAPVNTSFVKVNSTATALTQQYVTFEDILASDYTTVIEPPGFDTRFATEKAIVDYVEGLNYLTEDQYWDRVEWPGNGYIITPKDPTDYVTTGFSFIVGNPLSGTNYTQLSNTQLDSWGVDCFNHLVIANPQLDGSYLMLTEVFNSNPNVFTSFQEIVKTAGDWEDGVNNGASWSIATTTENTITAPLVRIQVKGDGNISFPQGTINKYLYLDANYDITYVDGPAETISSVTDGLWDLDITANSLSIIPFTSRATNTFYVDVANLPSHKSDKLMYDGGFYATDLYSGGAIVMTAHGNQAATGTFHALSNSTHNGFLRALPSVNPTYQFLRGDGNWTTMASMLLTGIPTYADNAAAVTGGLAVDKVYKTVTGELRIVV